jgi:hypothetical protein
MSVRKKVVEDDLREARMVFHESAQNRIPGIEVKNPYPNPQVSNLVRLLSASRKDLVIMMERLLIRSGSAEME